MNNRERIARAHTMREFSNRLAQMADRDAREGPAPVQREPDVSYGQYGPGTNAAALFDAATGGGLTAWNKGIAPHQHIGNIAETANNLLYTATGHPFFQSGVNDLAEGYGDKNLPQMVRGGARIATGALPFTRIFSKAPVTSTIWYGAPEVDTSIKEASAAPINRASLPPNGPPVLPVSRQSLERPAPVEPPPQQHPAVAAPPEPESPWLKNASNFASWAWNGISSFPGELAESWKTPSFEPQSYQAYSKASPPPVVPTRQQYIAEAERRAVEGLPGNFATSRRRAQAEASRRAGKEFPEVERNALAALKGHRERWQQTAVADAEKRRKEFYDKEFLERNPALSQVMNAASYVLPAYIARRGLKKINAETERLRQRVMNTTGSERNIALAELNARVGTSGLATKENALKAATLGQAVATPGELRIAGDVYDANMLPPDAGARERAKERLTPWGIGNQLASGAMQGALLAGLGAKTAGRSRTDAARATLMEEAVDGGAARLVNQTNRAKLAKALRDTRSKSADDLRKYRREMAEISAAQDLEQAAVHGTRKQALKDMGYSGAAIPKGSTGQKSLPKPAAHHGTQSGQTGPQTGAPQPQASRPSSAGSSTGQTQKPTGGAQQHSGHTQNSQTGQTGQSQQGGQTSGKASGSQSGKSTARKVNKQASKWSIEDKDAVKDAWYKHSEKAQALDGNPKDLSFIPNDLRQKYGDKRIKEYIGEVYLRGKEIAGPKAKGKEVVDMLKKVRAAGGPGGTKFAVPAAAGVGAATYAGSDAEAKNRKRLADALAGLDY